MAINWLVALKAVPWTDLVQAAPGIVKSARKLFAGARESASRTTGATHAGAQAGAGTSVEARLEHVETTLAMLSEDQRASADLIRSLADQNARMVEAMAVLQARARIMLGLCIGLVLAFVTLAIWVVTR